MEMEHLMELQEMNLSLGTLLQKDYDLKFCHAFVAVNRTMVMGILGTTTDSSLEHFGFLRGDMSRDELLQVLSA